MQFDLDEDRALLKTSTRELLEAESPLAEARGLMEESADGYSKALYAQLAELGYMSLLLPEEEGGMGAVAFAAVLSEMGRTAFPGPFLDVALAVRALAGCDHEAASGLAARASAGEAHVVVLCAEEEEPFVLKDGRLSGRRRFIPFGATADALLVETADGLVLVERPGTGWNAKPLPTVDHAQRFVAVELDEPATLVAGPEAASLVVADVQRLGSLGAAALMLGLMERSLELALEYTGEREAFGAPIASFQALQHRCADAMLQVESTRSSVFRAAWAEDHTPSDSPYLVAVAKAWAGPAGRWVCGQTIQLHGGVGYTWEYDPHIFLKRTKTLEQFYGSTRTQLESALQRAL